MVVVELVCRAEGRTVAVIETEGGTLDAKAIRGGMKVRDRARAPHRPLIQDGVQLTCGRCHESLYFRAQEAVSPVLEKDRDEVEADIRAGGNAGSADMLGRTIVGEEDKSEAAMAAAKKRALAELAAGMIPAVVGGIKVEP